MNKDIKPQIPTISVILPIYNVIKWLIKSIDSVIAQIYTNWELLANDDLSSDGTDTKTQEFYVMDPIIQYFKLSVIKEVGISKFLNFGLNNGKGKYIARLYDDDK